MSGSIKINIFWLMCPSLLLYFQCLRLVFHFCILSLNLSTLGPMCTRKFFFSVIPLVYVFFIASISWSRTVCFLQHLSLLVSPLFGLCFPGCLWGIYWFPPIVLVFLDFIKGFSHFLFKELQQLHILGLKAFV